MESKLRWINVINIGISGCNGAMGRVLTEIIEQLEDVQIVLGIDRNSDLYNKKYPVYEKASQIDIRCDVIIDFSHPSNLEDLLNSCVEKKIAIVIATTGISEQQNELIYKSSQHIPIFKSFNMSLGINLLLDLVKKSAIVLSDTFDIEIIEKHHNKKVDAPSGTAYMIADSINEVLKNSMTYSYERHGFDAKRNKKEIGIHAVRGGTITGEHSIIFAGMDEIIEIKHTALSKKIFAEGALKAAKYIVEKESSLYCMNDLINEE